MKTIPMKGITAGIIGLLTTATIGITQEAQAGTVRASSRVNFDNVTLNLISPNGNTNVVPLFFNSLNGQANLSLDGFSDNKSYGVGPVPCTGTPISGIAAASVLPNANGTANGGSAIDCSGGSIVTASNFADLSVTGQKGNSTAAGLYTINSDDFQVNAGDVLDLNGIFTGTVTAAIENYRPGDMKNINSTYVATYRIFLNGQEINIGAPTLTDSLTFVNETNSDSRTTGPISINNIADYTFLPGQSGVVRIQFDGREQVNGAIMQNIPEPSTLVGLTAIGIGALVSRKKKNNTDN